MVDKKLFLLDGHALVYRAHYAFINRPLMNSKGMNTSAVMGFVRTLWDLMRQQSPSHIAVAFDVSSKTFRNEYYPEYKANRDAQPEDITAALPYIYKIVEAFNIPVMTHERYEADDLIGTVAKQAEAEGFTVYLVTPDKDFAQLVSDRVFLYKPSRQGNGVDILGEKEILEKWQIKRVEQVIDVLGLQGDAVDNIPGIPGVGPKTAVKLLAAYDSVEGVIEHVDELKGKLQERVREHQDMALLSKRLATIELEAPVQFSAERYVVEDPNRPALAELFKELEFRTLSQQILGTPGEQQALFQRMTEAPKAAHLAQHEVAERRLGDVDHDYILIDTADERRLLAQQMRDAELYCFDTETTGLDSMSADIVGLSIALKTGQAYYVPLSPDTQEARTQLADFKEAFSSGGIVVAQNIKYDVQMLRRYGIDVIGIYYDTMIMHYLLEPELRHGMDYLAETYLKYKPISITELIGKKGKKQKNMRDLAPAQVLDYAAEDADVTLQLYEYLRPRLEEEGLHNLYLKIEEPLIKVITDMEMSGIKLDVDYLQDYSHELKEKIVSLKEEIYKQAGTEFNISSPKQVGEILFDHLKVPYRWRKTSSGQYSTSEEKLNELSKDHDIISDILKYRMLTKLLSTYVDALPKMVNANTDRIHSSFNQALAATGRLSSNNPNLQNIPIRTPEGRRIRRAFIPGDEEHILLAADYSQIELRLIAAISGDNAMLEAFKLSQDIHRATAARVYGVAYDEVRADQRRAAKTVNFSIIYGAGATNLSHQLDISRKEATALIEQYFTQYPGLKKYMEDTIAYARENGHVTTHLGRRRPLRDINSRNGMARSAAERIAINTPIQGTAADLIKIAMIDIHAEMQARNMTSRMILQVHDELVFDVYRPELEELKDLIINKMETAIDDLDVPILVEAGVGEDWLEAH